MNFLKKEYTIKNTIGKMLIESLIFTLIISIIIYFILSKANGALIEMLKLINDGKAAFSVVAWLVPLILIITITLELLKLVIHAENK